MNDKRTAVQQDALMEMTAVLLNYQKLSQEKRTAVQYYLKGMLDTRLLENEISH